MKYARIENSWVQEVFVCEEGKTINEYFYPTLAALFETVPDHVSEGWYKKPDGTFSPPPEPPVPIPVTTPE